MEDAVAKAKEYIKEPLASGLDLERRQWAEVDHCFAPIVSLKGKDARGLP